MFHFCGPKALKAKHQKRVLFICKRNEVYSFVTTTRRSCGLYNSTSFIVKALRKAGHYAHIVEVKDNNDIDREVHKFKPDIVVIEALWVVPEKFTVLKKLHPRVKWFIHLHSNMPFLALEGIAMEWIKRYIAEQDLGMIANSWVSYEALSVIVPRSHLFYLPNVFSGEMKPPRPMGIPYGINIGCFGAVRPMKNHLLQAMAAIRFANHHKRRLLFYVNASRIEVGGAPVLKNLKALFKGSAHELVEAHWFEPEEFDSVLAGMDIGMQVSLTETFNVVSANYVTAGLPVVASKEITWLDDRCKARDDSIDDIVRVMNRVWKNKKLIEKNQNNLLKHEVRASKMWNEFIHEL